MFWINGVADQRYRIGVKAFVEKVSPTYDFAKHFGTQRLTFAAPRIPLQSAGLCYCVPACVNMSVKMLLVFSLTVQIALLSSTRSFLFNFKPLKRV